MIAAADRLLDRLEADDARHLRVLIATGLGSGATTAAIAEAARVALDLGAVLEDDPAALIDMIASRRRAARR